MLSSQSIQARDPHFKFEITLCGFTNPLAGLQNGLANLQTHFAGLQNGFADLQPPSQACKVGSRIYKPISRPCKMGSRFYKPISRPREPLSRLREAILRGYTSVFHQKVGNNEEESVSLGTNLKTLLGMRKSYLLINEFQTLTRLSQAEYLTFMNHVFGLVKEVANEEPSDEEDSEIFALGDNVGDAPAIGIDRAFMNEMSADLLKMADAVNESTIAQETEAMQTHEKNRDNLATYILTRITCAGSLPLQAERDAGKALYKVVKPYVGIARLTVSKETTAIRGLLLDLRKEEYATYVAALNLTAYMDELETENEAYDALYKARFEGRAANTMDAGSVIRARLDEYYKELTLLAQSCSVVMPSEESDTFIRNLNQLTAETTAAYNQRIAQLQAAKKRKEEPIPVNPTTPEA